MTNLLIPQQLAQVVVDYLAQRPYAEVHQLIGAMLALEQAAEVEEGDEDVTG